MEGREKERERSEECFESKSWLLIVMREKRRRKENGKRKQWMSNGSRIPIFERIEETSDKCILYGYLLFEMIERKRRRKERREWKFPQTQEMLRERSMSSR